MSANPENFLTSLSTTEQEKVKRRLENPPNTIEKSFVCFRQKRKCRNCQDYFDLSNVRNQFVAVCMEIAHEFDTCVDSLVYSKLLK